MPVVPLAVCDRDVVLVVDGVVSSLFVVVGVVPPPPSPSSCWRVVGVVWLVSDDLVVVVRGAVVSVVAVVSVEWSSGGGSVVAVVCCDPSGGGEVVPVVDVVDGSLLGHDGSLESHVQCGFWLGQCGLVVAWTGVASSSANTMTTRAASREDPRTITRLPRPAYLETPVWKSLQAHVVPQCFPQCFTVEVVVAGAPGAVDDVVLGGGPVPRATLRLWTR